MTAAPLLAALLGLLPAQDGEALYLRLCAACHGARGDGRGLAAPLFDPPPRDFSRGEFKWRTTPSGAPPTREDLERTIRYGAPGTGMPAFGRALDAGEIAALVQAVAARAPAVSPTGAALPWGRPPADLGTPAAAARGRGAWQHLRCAECHGDDLGGRPDRATYDLRGALHGGPAAADVYRALRTGLLGTAMPSYQGAASDGELWDVAAYVVAQRRDGPLPAVPVAPPSRRPAAPLDDEAYWRRPLAPQGPPPERLSPAETDLDPGACGKCHGRQERDWSASIHARAMGPGVRAQLFELGAAEARSCRDCHAPLPEQTDNPALGAQGIVCAACHLRGFVRHGPPAPASTVARIAPLDYPLVRTPFLERAEFCLGCHQHDDQGVAGRPLLDTYREWMASPYARRGIVCQSCHMPDREHGWRGIHDPLAVRQALRVRVRFAASGAPVRTEVALTNVAAGHRLPTTPTPRLVVRHRAAGRTQSYEIGRHLEYTAAGWQERFDHRLAPGETVRLVFAERAAAEDAEVTVELRPDAYYEGFYAQALVARHARPVRALYEQALGEARSHAVVLYRFRQRP